MKSYCHRCFSPTDIIGCYGPSSQPEFRYTCGCEGSELRKLGLSIGRRAWYYKRCLRAIVRHLLVERFGFTPDVLYRDAITEINAAYMVTFGTTNQKESKESR